MNTKEMIENYKELYIALHGIELDDWEAYEKGTRLLRFFELYFELIEDK